ncbi:hypothetical protein FQA39_LY18339 [Lamprigera yunnana]|nr:hypothetical protein FQA39_LY18339 [Lamprigera yunnana]
MGPCFFYSRISQIAKEAFGLNSIGLLQLVVVDETCKVDMRNQIIEAWDKMLNLHKEECIKESGADENDVSNIFKTDTIPDSYSMKCFLKCHHVFLGFMDEKGNLNDEEILKGIAGADVEYMKICNEVAYKEVDLCNRMFEYVKCGVTKILAKFT